MVPALLCASLLLTTSAPASAAPASSDTPAPPVGRLVRRSIAATMWPVEPALSGGFVWSSAGIVPFGGATIMVPIIPGVGPIVAGRVAGSTVGTSSFLEGMVGIGVGWEGRMGELRARAGLVPAAVVTTVGDDVASSTTVTPGVLVPLELAVPLGAGVSFGAVIEPGLATPVFLVLGNQVESGRDRLFVNVGASLTFGGPVD